MSEVGAQLGVELVTCKADSVVEAEAALLNVPEKAAAIFLLPDNVIDAWAANVLKIATELKLPTSGPNMMAVNNGALTAYGVDLPIAARQQAARLADRILHGDKPSDMPVEMAQLFLAINMKTAQAIGLDISDDILRQANFIIR